MGGSLKKIHFACPRWLCSFSICWTIVTALHKHQYIKVLSATTLLRNNWRPLSWRWKFVIFYPFPCFSFLTFLYICSNYKTSRALWTEVLFSSVLEKKTFIQSRLFWPRFTFSFWVDLFPLANQKFSSLQTWSKNINISHDTFGLEKIVIRFCYLILVKIWALCLFSWKVDRTQQNYDRA